MGDLDSSPSVSQQLLQWQEELSNARTDQAGQSLISSEKWLQLHGLRSSKLTLEQILSQVAFPQSEDYVTSLGRLVTSRYADGLFPQYYRAEDGRLYNLTATSDRISQFVDDLTRAVESYKQRMDWLTSKSRQIFGVILEQCVTIVLDCGDILEGELNLCRDALTMVLREQVAHITKFNIIWASEESVKWQACATNVTNWSIEAAISWIEKLPFDPVGSGEVGCLEALLDAGEDESIESIYYFVVGDISKESKKLLLQGALVSPYPVCTVSFNARGEGTIAFLKDLSAKTHGRFHAFAERTECLEFPAFSTEGGACTATWNSRKLKGKLPPGAGVREDVFLVWREMEEACSTLAEVQKLVAICIQSKESPTDCVSAENELDPEDTWDSQKWLQKYGLKAQKLSFYDAVADCSFRHADGLIDIRAKPEDKAVRTSAETNKKTVHAKYCSRFVHAPWKDGSLVHVSITKEKCKWYSERVHGALARIQRRIKWLQEGSQLLFGKACQDCIYVLIDTSHSMKSKLELVKGKILRFIQEQLKYKSKFNFVTFDGQAVAWREKLAEVNEDSLQQAQSWIRDIKVGSSTNTLNALNLAFSDKETQVIYLLTDGRPDQPPEMVLEQVKLFQKIPIHAISFCYNDETATAFLKELASLTGGEFHAYHFGCKDPIPLEAVQQDEDLSLLLEEVQQGFSDLEKMQSLYSESLIMDWWYNAEKAGDSKHQKEIFSMGSTPGNREKLHCDAELLVTSPLNMLKVPRDLLGEKQPKKKALHAESTQTSQLRRQMWPVKSSGCSEQDSLSSACSSTLALKDQETNTLLTNDSLDDKLPEKLTQEGSQVYNNSSEMSSTVWLQTHGLVAKKLTLMDALSETSVPHSPTYVPILDKHVVSKVFDKVFPLAHVCSNTNKMTLVNPQGVKLNIYKQKVEKAINSYEKRLDRLVWQALSQEEKEKLDAVKPIQYMENKDALNEALERLNWPISIKELQVLENEIQTGKMYIQQAIELQEAAGRKREDKAPDEQQKSQKTSPKKIKSKKVYPLTGQKVIARCDENGFYFPGVVKKCLSSTHALVDFRYGDTEIVPTSFITPIGGAMPCPLLQVGDYVFAKIVTPKGFDFYVPAIVITLPSQNADPEKLYTVLKCNNRREFCPRSALIKISQNKYALSCSHIKSHPIQEDVRVENMDTKNSFPLCQEKEAGPGQPRQENLRKKKKKAAKRPPLQGTLSSDSDGSPRSPQSSPNLP